MSTLLFLSLLGALIAALLVIDLLTERQREIDRLGDLTRVDELEEAQRSLWPTDSRHVAALERWLAEARAVLARREGHRQARSGLQSRLEDESRPPSAFERWKLGQLESLDTRIDLLQSLERFVTRRLSVADDSCRDSRWQERWATARASIANIDECPAYGGREIIPQKALLPLGRNDTTRLWEFVDLQTGEPPEIDDTGQPVLTPETGVVFVLLPGGRFTMGADRPTPGAPAGSPNVDPYPYQRKVPFSPAHEVQLHPFFYAKYETTVAQWERIMGPTERRQLPLEPVGELTWAEAAELADRLGAHIPTEARWEYATRGGTRSIWWTGDEPDSMVGAENLEVDGDGYPALAPIGRFRPNGFGLHDTAGNMGEWCRDRPASYDQPVAPADGERSGTVDKRIARGGIFDGDVIWARSALRTSGSPEILKNHNLGVRLSRDLDADP